MEVVDGTEAAIVPASALNSDELDDFYTMASIRPQSKHGLEESHIAAHSSDSTSTSPSSSPPGDLSNNKHRHETRTTMTFSSSPVLYPPSSSPLQLPKKRKLFQTLTLEPAPKKAKVTTGLVEEHEVDFERPRRDTVCGSMTNTSTKSATIATTFDELDESKPTSAELLKNRLLTRKVNGGNTVELETSSGQKLRIPLRTRSKPESYEQTIAHRSATTADRAKKAYYGIEVHRLVDEARIQQELDEATAEVEKQRSEDQDVAKPTSIGSVEADKIKHQMWTEKYRARKFTELVGDERTHRSVLRWLKAWDDIVFPGTKKLKARKIHEDDHDRQHRKILLLTGPPGLGKTTLAHVCAKQAGYEALEINASDDRSREVVKGRIADALGTETVRGIKEQGKARRAGRPVCVIVDEVDGAVAGSGSSGEGGFMRALIDLVQLDARNSSGATKTENGRKKKGDNFRLLRPLILICNDAYAPSLRPLRTSSAAEIVHVRRPALDKIIIRMRTVFETERILCDNDAIRRLCENSWGMGTRKQNSLGGRGAGEGDLRSVLVQAEWAAHKFRLGEEGQQRLTRKWVESHFSTVQSRNGQKGLGRGGLREVIDRIFLDGAGLPNLPTKLSADDERLVSESKTTNIGVADMRKRAAITALREMVDMCGEYERLMTDCFTTYPHQVFQDDTRLSKPNEGYDWLHFYDCLSSRIFSSQEWELNPYLSTGACGFHNLFACTEKGDKSWNDEAKDDEETETHPFAGLKADFAAHEAEKQNRTILTELQASFAAPLLRLFSSVDDMATELIPHIIRILAPDVKPIVVGGSGSSASVASVRKESERLCVQQSVRVMNALHVRFDKIKIEVDAGAQARGGFAYRMEPPLDTLTTFHMDKTATAAPAPVRYAVRQVLDQELQKHKILQSSVSRQGGSLAIHNSLAQDDDKENQPLDAKGKAYQAASKPAAVKRDFFGRIVNEVRPTSAEDAVKRAAKSMEDVQEDRVWVSFHEGFSNAVRKPITLRELLESF